MRILVTGGAGYIGSQMVRELLHHGDEVVVFDNLIGGHKESLPKETKFIIGDILDRDALANLFKAEKIDAVIHFAGMISMAESMENPYKYFSTNTIGALTLIETMVKTNVRKLIFSSTAGVYGNPAETPIKEDDTKNPTNPYGYSKLMVEQMLSWYDKIYNLRSISLRYFNAAGATLDGNYGEDHKEETHIIPLALKSALAKSEFTIFGNDYKTKDGTCVRDYVHVIDLCDAHLLALDALLNSHKTDVFNVGPGVGYSNKEVVDKVKEITRIDFPIVTGKRRPGDVDELIADASKIKQELGWKPKHSDLETIVKTAWEWHKNHLNGYQA